MRSAVQGVLVALRGGPGGAFNLAIFAAGLLGATLISTYDGRALPLAVVTPAPVALTVALAARRTAFTAPQ